MAYVIGEKLKKYTHEVLRELDVTQMMEYFAYYKTQDSEWMKNTLEEKAIAEDPNVLTQKIVKMLSGEKV